MDSTEHEIFYKGRVDKNILTTWDMFHIPFNKRYLIKNQRYSITGQPLIYLGLSIIDIVEELEVDKKDIECLKSSTYQLPDTMKIFDLRNNIYNNIIDNSIESIFNDREKNDYKPIFYRNILSSVCSFEKRREHKEYHFCEEYVLPQILAQVLKNHNFDGIRYISTKKFNGLSTENYIVKSDEESSDDIKNRKREYSISEEIIGNYKTLYKENLALFTNIDYKVSEVYDKNLYYKIKISKPLDIYRLEDITMDNLEEILNEIEFFGDRKLYSEASSIYEKFRREFSEIKINGERYLDLDVGKIHINHIHILMSSVLQKCMRSGKKYE